MRFFIAALTFLLTSLTHADSIYVGAWSKHFHSNYEMKADNCPMGPCAETDYSAHKIQLNETNNLFAYEYHGLIVGHMTNSFNQSTFLFAKQFELVEFGELTFSANVGAVHGYNNCHFNNQGNTPKLCPSLTLEISYTKYFIQPTLLITSKAAAITTKWQF